jgi:predicted Zn-dependent protease
MRTFNCIAMACLLSGALLPRAFGAETGSYKLIGKIVEKDSGAPIKVAPGRRGIRFPVVFLEGTTIPFTASVFADLNGSFVFKNLHADLFTLVVYIPLMGEYKRTVEVSGGLADPKRRIFVEVPFQRSLASQSLQTVSPKELSIPQNALKEYRQARIRLKKQDTAGAISHLKKCVALAPQFADAWNELGTIAYKTNNLPQAENYFREALKHNPEYYPAIVNLGGTLLTQGKLKEALPLNELSVTKMPDDALAYSQLGQNLYYLGRIEEAERNLRQAISLDPGHFSYPQLILADIYFRQSRLSDADLQLQQFFRLHPGAKLSSAMQKRIEYIQGRIANGR